MSRHFLQSSPQELEETLQDVNRLMAEKEASSKAGSLHLPYIDLHNFPVDLNVLGMFTKEEAENSGAVPFFKDLKDLRIGVTDPNNPLLKEKIRELSDKNKISLYFISLPSFRKTLGFFSKVLRPKEQRDETVRIVKAEDYLTLLQNLQDQTRQQALNATAWLQTIFGASIVYKSSDIHLEPEEHFFKLRFRVDGVLQDILHLDNQLRRSIIMRIKILSKMKLNVENVPQDGRMTFYYLTKPIDVRVSILPSAYGEEVVMRLLGTMDVELRLKNLGFRPKVLQILRKELEKPNGMIITTGPTGSGKTTSLYTFLNELNEPGVKIITLEDPVEYKLEGIVQTQIDHSVEYDFAKGLRAILRQDPDIVMVGEIRDQETAEVAMQAALTGHLVFSTLHTNDASGAFPRLINMGVKPFVIGPAMLAVLAQRLVRKICPHCKVSYALAPAMLEKIKYILNQLPKQSGEAAPAEFKFFHSPGCPQCHNLGYQGRVGIYELLEVTDAVQKLIMKEATTAEFKRAAFEQGMVTMTQDGLLKALEGITDVEEVFRVAGEG